MTRVLESRSGPAKRSVEANLAMIGAYVRQHGFISLAQTQVLLQRSRSTARMYMTLYRIRSQGQAYEVQYRG